MRPVRERRLAAPEPRPEPSEARTGPEACAEEACAEEAWPACHGFHGPLQPVDHRWLRHINQALVLACLREHGPLARVALAARTQLSRTTVSAITQALLEEGLIREGERLPAAPHGGRRAILLHLVAD